MDRGEVLVIVHLGLSALTNSIVNATARSVNNRVGEVRRFFYTLSFNYDYPNGVHIFLINCQFFHVNSFPALTNSIVNATVSSVHNRDGQGRISGQ